VKLIFHLDDGKIEEFTTDKSSVSIGRGNTCDIVLPIEGFSRRHAQIDLVDGSIFVTDLGSTNGVYIDGQRIPVSTRTLMQSFLNLQIGPANQIEILDEDAAPASVPSSHSDFGHRKISKEIDSSEKTKSTRFEPRQLKKTVEKKPGVKTQNSKLSMFFVPVLLVGAAAYYYMNSSEESAPVSVAPQEVAAPSVPLQETKFLSSAMLASFDKSKSCAGVLLNWCKDAGVLEESQEGVVIEGRTLLVYMNMTPLVATKYAEKVEALDPRKRLEILLLRRIFNSFLMRSISRQTQIDNVQVIGGLMEQGQWKLKMAVKLKRDIDLVKADKFFMYSLFDQILNQGEVEKLSEIASFYEDLPLEE
jgi:hypothetical protein